MTFRAANIASTVAPYDIVRKMRASILVLGPLLARAGEATVSLPGGCAIGNRPIDLHLKALQALGAEIEIAAGYVKAIAPKGGLTGGTISFPIVSVGATENALMAAVLAKGTTRDRKCGARARDHRSRLMPDRDGRRDRGAEERHADHPRQGSAARRHPCGDARPDRGRLLCLRGDDHRRLAGAGRRARGFDARHPLRPRRCRRASSSSARAASRSAPMAGSSRCRCRPRPYPAFPTDMQAQFMAMLALADGTSLLTETIFENRYMHVPELSPDGRRHRGARPLGGGARRRRPDRRAGDGDRPARLDEPGPGRPRRRRARPRSTGSTISTAATSGSRRNCRRSARISSGSATADACSISRFCSKMRESIRDRFVVMRHSTE